MREFFELAVKEEVIHMMEVKPHWSPDADYSSCPFFIRRMDTLGYFKPVEAPMAQLPLVGFIYVTSGEVLVDVAGTSFLCQPGQILLIPQHHPFTIRYYRSAIGYTGGFAPSALADSKLLLYLSAPLHQGFWFDEGAFVAELFNMLATSFEKGDSLFLATFQERDGYNAICLPKKDARIILIPSLIGLKYHAAYSELCPV